MTVHVVTDSSSCLPKELAEQAKVSVLDLHTDGEGADRTTAGLGALELTACYARLLERGGDAGVVAIHLSKELSATWSNAVSAAGIFDGKVRVMDTNTAGMVNGFAALKAAEIAQAGGSLEDCFRAAQRVIDESNLWLYVHRLDAIRKGGRLSTGQTLLTTALAIKPILRLEDGRIALAAKTRTQGKAMDKLVNMVTEVVIEEATRAAVRGESPRRIRVAVHENEAVDVAEKLIASMQERVEELRIHASSHDGPFAIPDGSEKKKERLILAKEKARIRDMVKAEKTKTEKVHTDKAKAQKVGTEQGKSGDHKDRSVGFQAVDASGVVQRDETEAMESIAGTHYDPADIAIPDVEFSRIQISDVLSVHTGPSSIAVTTVFW
ncbi:DegV family EDD domain-containing protein [Corynebacterium sp. 4HC-13]|uniref:DegV family protein n=1 Tax=Corynebacterium anserum TaxID=2684406 RepID=UPI00163A0390|nr:DegV family protein [Corynebacterium anserum]MBC2681112.1 DegV family EDD domain-containing protein [Corynebacterium anserum]